MDINGVKKLADSLQTFVDWASKPNATAAEVEALAAVAQMLFQCYGQLTSYSN